MKKSEIHLWQMGSVIAILLPFAFLHFAKVTLDLFLVIPISLLLIAYFKKLGFIASMMLFSFASLMVHLFTDVSHFWRLGIEASLATSLSILFLILRNDLIYDKKQEEQLSIKESALKNLEEEFRSKMDEGIKEQMASFEKIELLRKELSDLETEKNAIEILNDVIRKNQAASFEREKELKLELQEAEKAFDDACYIIDNQTQKEEDFLDWKSNKDYELMEKREQAYKEENALLQEIISFAMRETNCSHLSHTIREAFSSKGNKAPTGPSPEETLREALLLKKKKKVSL